MFRLARPKGLKQRHKIIEILSMSGEKVKEMFMSLPDAKAYREGDKQAIYIPGKRSDRIVLVAHADTVFAKQIVPSFFDGSFVSADSSVGIGADDRAGVAILWFLRNSGHSLLITWGEEKGCIGANAVKENTKLFEELNEHNFMLEFDRMGESDIAFYDVATDDFKKYLEENMPGYTRTFGSSTDIKVICNKICGGNFSVGYYGQHGTSEHLVEYEFERILRMAAEFVSKPTKKFVLPEKPKYQHSSGNNYRQYKYMDRDDYYRTGYGHGFHEHDCAYEEAKHLSQANRYIMDGVQPSVQTRKNDYIYHCSYCGGFMLRVEKNINNKCMFCFK